MGGMCGSKTRQAHFPQQQQQQQEHEEEHVRSQEGWSSRSGDGTARQAHPMKSTGDRDPESFTGPSKPYSGTMTANASPELLVSSNRLGGQETTRTRTRDAQRSAISNSATIPKSSSRMATKRSVRRRSFGLAKTGGIDLETRNSRRQSPIHVSHPGESTQIPSAEYRLPTL
jgi:hypothetical protein